MTSDTLERCAGCGLEIKGGTAGCQALKDELSAREFGDARYFGVHRMSVDTYCLQHPDRYCASAKSLAAHLTGLCWLLNHSGNKAVGSDALRRWLNTQPRLTKPEIPAFRGEVTVADVYKAPTVQAYTSAVQRWARSTWEAYAPLHGVAEEWIRLAVSGQRR